MPGLSIQLNDINNVSGDICRGVTLQLRRAANFKRFLDRFTAADLVANYGFTVGDANLIKSAFTDLATINTAFQANRVFLDQLSGMGDV